MSSLTNLISIMQNWTAHGENIKARTFDGQTLYSKDGYINRKQNTIKLKMEKYTTCSKIEMIEKNFVLHGH